jgi:predicted ATPase
VGQICARLEGLPLAIELAAARIKVLSPTEILKKLENRLKLLIGGARDLPARQQTMRSTIEWSYDLLNEDEKALFRCLAVFSGGFTIEAAETVINSQFPLTHKKTVIDKETQTTNREEPAIDVLEGITSLVDKSLLVLSEPGSNESRFRMLEVVREYALESLTDKKEDEAMRRRHAAYFLALAEKAEPHLADVQAIEWLNRLEEERDNLRDSLRFASRYDIQLGQRLSGSLWRFWLAHGHITEGCDQLELFLSQNPKTTNKETRIKMLLGAGYLNRVRGNFALTRSYAQESLALAHQTDDKKAGAFSFYQLGLPDSDSLSSNKCPRHLPDNKWHREHHPFLRLSLTPLYKISWRVQCFLVQVRLRRD